jgi:hypothetical protein
MKFKLFGRALAGLILLSSSSVANAGLIEADLSVANDNLAVYDTSSNLTWLDLSQTFGMSINTAINNFSEFRLANQSEVIGLWTSQYPLIDFNLQFNYLAADVNTGNQIMSLFGSIYEHTFGMYVQDNSVIANIGTRTDGRLFTDENWISYTSSLDYQSSWHGVYMVQKSESVPEPSTLAIFALGMIGLASRRFKKQS